MRQSARDAKNGGKTAKRGSRIEMECKRRSVRKIKNQRKIAGKEINIKTWQWRSYE